MTAACLHTQHSDGCPGAVGCTDRQTDRQVCMWRDKHVCICRQKQKYIPYTSLSMHILPLYLPLPPMLRQTLAHTITQPVVEGMYVTLLKKPQHNFYYNQSSITSHTAVQAGTEHHWWRRMLLSSSRLSLTHNSHLTTTTTHNPPSLMHTLQKFKRFICKCYFIVSTQNKHTLPTYIHGLTPQTHHRHTMTSGRFPLAASWAVTPVEEQPFICHYH